MSNTSVTITAAMVNELRGRTGAGLMDCKKALVEANGDYEEAITILKKKGIASAAKRAGREATEGLIESYIHFGGKIGVLVEMGCETDFVARNEEFRNLAKDICMQIAAMSPLYVSRDEVAQDLVAKEREVAIAQCEGKPAAAIDKIVEGKLDKWFAQICLLEQSLFKDQEIAVRDYIAQMITKIGENIIVRRFARYQLGE
ncbi:MAG TPA: translation elongation factor Ts [Opitutales bacterium]|nr:translation elongation factor Ts [Opitutales bacterium]